MTDVFRVRSIEVGMRADAGRAGEQVAASSQHLAIVLRPEAPQWAQEGGTEWKKLNKTVLYDKQLVH